MAEFWFNVRTHEIEEGAQSDWRQLIGPYPTRGEAEGALAKVAKRNEEWDAADEDED